MLKGREGDVMDALEGLWRLVEGRAWDAQGNELAPPYGRRPLGELMFLGGRMLAAVCKDDPEFVVGESRGFSSYGGPYTFDGKSLVTQVDVSSDARRIGGEQRRSMVFLNERTIIMHPPQRAYEGSIERRELRWERVWRPAE
jgi:hypothetical protein